MKRDKPYRLQKKEKYDNKHNTIEKIQDHKLRSEPCKPPCDNKGKKGQ